MSERVADTSGFPIRGPVYWYKPLNLSHEEAEAIVDGDVDVITTKNGVAINTYERLRDGKYRVGIFHGKDAYLFTMKEIALEDGYVKIQLMKPGERFPG